MSMKKLYILLISITIVTSFAHAQRIDRSKFISDSLDLYVSRALTNWRIPGAAVCIVKDCGTRYQNIGTCCNRFESV